MAYPGGDYSRTKNKKTCTHSNSWLYTTSKEIFLCLQVFLNYWANMKTFCLLGQQATRARFGCTKKRKQIKQKVPVSIFANCYFLHFLSLVSTEGTHLCQYLVSTNRSLNYELNVFQSTASQHIFIVNPLQLHG